MNPKAAICAIRNYTKIERPEVISAAIETIALHYLEYPGEVLEEVWNIFDAIRDDARLIWGTPYDDHNPAYEAHNYLLMWRYEPTIAKAGFR